MKKLLRVGNSIAAEYIGVGAYGKHIIVNAYAGNIRVQELPALIPLGLYIEIFPHEETPTQLRIELKVGRQSRGKIDTIFEFEENMPGLLIVPQIPVEIPKELDIKLLAHGEGFAPVTLFKTHVWKDKII